MKPIISKELFKKEPKIIIRTIGATYAGIGAWCFVGLTLMSSTINSFPNDAQFSAFNRTAQILHNIWSTYMPMLIVIGISMVGFSYLFERLKEQRIAIQTGIVIVCSIWSITYSIAHIPYIEGFEAMLDEHLQLQGLTYIVAIPAFGSVLGMMTIPNYKTLKKMKAEMADM